MSGLIVSQFRSRRMGESAGQRRERVASFFKTHLLGLMLVALGPSCFRVEGAEYTLDDVKNRYRESISDLNPIWTRCTFSKTFDEEFPDRGHNNIRSELIEWAISGPRFYFQWQGANSTTWFSFDGRTTHEVDFGSASRGEDPRQPKCVRQQRLETRTDSDLRTQITPGRWLGLYFPLGMDAQSGESVSTLLEKPSAKLIGSEQCEGVPCVRVDVSFKMMNGDHFPVETWFDPAVGFLPRRIRMIWPDSTSDHVVQEFLSVESGSIGEVSFPSKMVLRYENSQYPTTNRTDILRVDEIRAGNDVRSDVFVPTVPKGTPVFRVDGREGRRNWQSFLAQGVPQDHSDATPPRSQARPFLASSDIEPVIVATADQGWPWTTILFVVGVMVLGVATLHLTKK